MKNLTRTTFVALAIFMSFFLVQAVLAGPRCDQVVEGTVHSIDVEENSIVVDTGNNVLVTVCGIPASILKKDLEEGDSVDIETHLCQRGPNAGKYTACSIIINGEVTIILRGK